MNYITTSKFNPLQNNMDNELTLFCDATCEDVTVINTYNDMLNRSDIDGAVNYINSSDMNTINASLFNRLFNMIQAVQNYYVDTQWDYENSEWKPKTDLLHYYGATADSIQNEKVWICPSSSSVVLNRAVLLKKNRWVSGEYQGYFYGEFSNYVPTGGGEFPIITNGIAVSYDEPIRLSRGKYRVGTNNSNNDSVYISVCIYSNAVYEGIWNAFENNTVEQGYSQYPSVEPIRRLGIYSDEDGTIDLTALEVEDGVTETDVFWMTLDIIADVNTVSYENIMKRFSINDIYMTLETC